MRALLAFFLISSVVATASPLPEYPFVQVNGSAERKVAPDKATITFRVKVYETEAERAYRKQADVADTVLGHAAKLGLPVEAAVAEAIEKAAVRREDDNGKEFEIIGYETNRKVRINVDDLEKFPPLIEFLYAQSNIEDIAATFGSKQETTIRQELTSEACQLATASAERLAKGFGRRLGTVRAVSEQPIAGIRDMLGFAGERFAFGADVRLSGRDFRVIPATIDFQKTVYAVFAIE